VSHPLHLTDAELVARLTQTEDSFVERKSQTDKSGWLRTTVAFANSTPIGLPSVLLIGVSDDGQISANVDIEKTLQAFSDHVGAHAWPPIYTLARELTHAGRSCVAIIVPGSPERPHFAGRAFVRAGTQTKDASPAQFAALIASHSSKARQIQAWAGKEISFLGKRRVGSDNHYRDVTVNVPVMVKSCGPYYATFVEDGSLARVFSEPLSRIELGYDNVRDRLWVYVYEDR
jgi:Putative DNA-binding domain